MTQRKDHMANDTATPPRLLITGSRTWTDRAAIRDVLRSWWDSIGRNPEAILVSGACPKGVDRICEELWEHNGLTVERHPAKWRKPDGSKDWKAGFDRNEVMVDTRPDKVIAFIHNSSTGTAHCIRYARKQGLDVDVHEVND